MQSSVGLPPLQQALSVKLAMSSIQDRDRPLYKSSKGPQTPAWGCEHMKELQTTNCLDSLRRIFFVCTA